MIKYLIITAVACALAAIPWRLPRRLRRRHKCIICGISTDDPIRYDGKVFNDETCRAQYEADKGLHRLIAEHHKPSAIGRAWRERRGFTLARVVAAGMLLLALLDLPYGYYQVLRVVVFAVAGYGAFQAAGMERTGWAWALGLLALIFNPVLPLHMTREAWMVLNVAGAVLLLASFGLLGSTSKTPHGAT